MLTTSPHVQSKPGRETFQSYNPGYPVALMTVEEFVKHFYPNSPLTSEHYNELSNMVIMRSKRIGHHQMLIRTDTYGLRMPVIVYEVEKLLKDELIRSYVVSESAKLELMA